MSLTLSTMLAGIVAMSSAVDIDRPENLSFLEAVSQGQLNGAVRARYEDVNQEAGSGDLGAQSLTLRTRLGYQTERYRFFLAGLEFTNITAIPDDDNYFDGSNAQTDDALVGDPEGSSLSQYWLGYDIANTLIKYGQQRVSLDNGRYLAPEDFRQGSSSLRGITLTNESLNFLRIRAGRLNHFNSPLYDDAPNSNESIGVNYFNIDYRGFIHSHLSLYSYQMDAGSPADLWGSQTEGVRFAGHIRNEPAIEYAFEIARQKDANSNPSDYSVRYMLLELGVTYLGVRVHGGFEKLGASAQGFFVSPLGALHEFQGWTDTFYNGGLGNIRGGIEDRYASLGYRMAGGFSTNLTVHRFESAHTASGYGNLGKEYNAELLYEGSGWLIGLRYADYHAKNFSQDTRKSWVDVEFSF